MDLDLRRPVGIDPSLTGTGASDGRTAITLKPPARLAGLERIRWIVEQSVLLCGEAYASCVVIEGPAYGKNTGSAHERAGLWWKLYDAFDLLRLDVVVVPPTVLKKYATGKGNADKDAVLLSTARRFDWFAGDNNAADALWLAAIGYDLEARPIVDMPELNRSALKSVDIRTPA